MICYMPILMLYPDLFKMLAAAAADFIELTINVVNVRWSEYHCKMAFCIVKWTYNINLRASDMTFMSI